MSTTEQSIDSTAGEKAKWGPGPWISEPDHVAFEHAGLPCIVHRVMSHGSLCGYVAVPPGHPWHGKNYNDVPADVHGGLTYGEKCAGDICHVPKPGEPDDVWWLGFDTGHCYDVSPAYAAHFPPMRDCVYRALGYVTEEVKRLAEQVVAASAPKATEGEATP